MVVVGLENLLQLHNLYSSKVKFGYHEKEVETLGKNPLQTPAHEFEEQSHKKIKNYAFISNISLQPNNNNSNWLLNIEISSPHGIAKRGRMKPEDGAEKIEENLSQNLTPHKTKTVANQS